MPSPKDPKKYNEWIRKLRGRELPNKLNISNEKLYELYIIKKLSIIEIAEKFKCSVTPIHSKLKKLGWNRSVSESKKGKESPNKDKSWEERFGIQQANEIREKLSKSLIGRPNKNKIVLSENELPRPKGRGIK